MAEQKAHEIALLKLKIKELEDLNRSEYATKLNNIEVSQQLLKSLESSDAKMPKCSVTLAQHICCCQYF